MLNAIVLVLLALVPLWFGYILQTKMNTDQSTDWVRLCGSAFAYFFGFIFLVSDIIHVIVYVLGYSIPPVAGILIICVSAIYVTPMTILLVESEKRKELK